MAEKVKVWFDAEARDRDIASEISIFLRIPPFRGHSFSHVSRLNLLRSLRCLLLKFPGVQPFQGWCGFGGPTPRVFPSIRVHGLNRPAGVGFRG